MIGFLTRQSLDPLHRNTSTKMGMVVPIYMSMAVPIYMFMAVLVIGHTEATIYSSCSSSTYIPAEVSVVNTLISENHPYDYPNYASCTYLIAAPESSSIQLSFSSFEVEPHSSCIYDSLQIYDGQSTSFPLLGTYCGSSIPRDVNSSSNYLTLLFSSDGSVTANGFSVDIKANEPGSANLTRGYCGYMLPVFAYGEPNSLYSYNYPDLYPGFQSCSWLITADPYRVIQFTLVDLDIENTTGCTADSLTVHDGSSYSSYTNILKSWCGSVSSLEENERSVVTTGNYAVVKFITDGSSNGRGFNLTYVYTDPPPPTTTTAAPTTTLPPGTYAGCTDGSTYTALSENQTILSPGYPYNYENNLDCRYILTASDPGYLVRVAIEYIDLETTSTCSYDYLSFRSGDDFTAPLQQKICHSRTSGLGTWPTSTGRSMAVSFVTDGSTTHSGFVLKFWQDHNLLAATAISPSGVITQYAYDYSNGTLYSPNWIAGFYLLPYANNLDTSWIITAYDDEHIVKVHTLDFNFQPSDYYGSCRSYDYLEFRDGDQAYSTVLDTWCGDRIGSSLQSTGMSLYIRMVTDSYDTYRGFKIHYWSVVKNHDEGDSEPSLGGGAIAGIVIGVIAFVVIIIICCCCHNGKSKKSVDVAPTPNTIPPSIKPAPPNPRPSPPPPYASVISAPVRPSVPRPPAPPAANQFGPPPAPNQYGPPPGPIPPSAPRFMPPPSAPQAPPSLPANRPEYPPPMFPSQQYPPPPHDPRDPPRQPPPSYATFARNGPAQGVYSIQTDIHNVPDALSYNTGPGYYPPSTPWDQSGVYYDNVNAGEDDPDAPPAIAMPAAVGKLDPITEAEIGKHKKRERKRKLKNAQNRLGAMSAFRDSVSDNHLKM